MVQKSQASSTALEGAMPEEFVEALKQREPEAFAQLVAQHGAMLYRVALRITGQPQDAEEVLQEALLHVYEKIGTFDYRAALPSWLYRIVVNTALMGLRARTRRPEELLDPLESAFTAAGQHARQVNAWALPPEEALLRQEALAHLEQAIARLPDLYRAVYVLTEIEGLRHEEIATILGITVSTAKTRLHRARLSLREALADYFEEKIP
jgi:RNA polymerase sigma-70 factor (ECF subfamily)